MIRISRLADYGILIMTAFAKSPTRRLSAVDVAKATNVALPTVRKLLKQLHEARLVASHRGSQGGYALSKPVKMVSIADIIVAIDGPIAMTDCSQAGHRCDKATVCDTKDNWQIVNRAIESALQEVSLQAMCQTLAHHPLSLKGIRIEAVQDRE